MKTFLVILFALSLEAQIFGPPTQFRKVTVATLPATPSTGYTVQVTDGASASDCSTGGGSTRVWCTWNGSSWQAMAGSGGGGGTELTAAATSGADNTIMRSVGNARAMEGTGCTISDTHQLGCTGGLAAAGTTAGAVTLNEANGSNFVAWKAADSLGADTTYLIPSTPPSGNQVLQCGTPSGGVSTCSFTSSASAAARYTFQGTTQAGQNAWNMNYAALTNMVWSTVDATNITPMLVVTANTSGSALRSVTPVTSTNPTITFQATVRSTDATNSGSIALAYACVPSGDSVNNPSFTSLTALTLATIDPDSEVFESSQAVTCTGTSASPARLYVKWTPTAPSGGTLSLISFALVY